MSILDNQFDIIDHAQSAAEDTAIRNILRGSDSYLGAPVLIRTKKYDDDSAAVTISDHKWISHPYVGAVTYGFEDITIHNAHGPFATRYYVLSNLDSRMIDETKFITPQEVESRWGIIPCYDHTYTQFSVTIKLNPDWDHPTIVDTPEIKLNLLLLKAKDYAGRNQFLIKFAS